MRGEPYDDSTGQLVALVVLALACVLLACGGDPKPPATPPTRIEVVRTACLVDPPPTHQPIEVDGPDDHCPEPWGACLSLESLIELGQYIARLQRWTNAAYQLCGPVPAEERETP